MKYCEDCSILNDLRRWLKAGAIIKATDVNKPILQWIDDDIIASNLTITFLPEGKLWERKE